MEFKTQMDEEQPGLQELMRRLDQNAKEAETIKKELEQAKTTPKKVVKEAENIMIDINTTIKQIDDTVYTIWQDQSDMKKLAQEAVQKTSIILMLAAVAVIGIAYLIFK